MACFQLHQVLLVYKCQPFTTSCFIFRPLSKDCYASKHLLLNANDALYHRHAAFRSTCIRVMCEWDGQAIYCRFLPVKAVWSGWLRKGELSWKIFWLCSLKIMQNRSIWFMYPCALLLILNAGNCNKKRRFGDFAHANFFTNNSQCRYFDSNLRQ